MVAFVRQSGFDQTWGLDGQGNFATFDDDGTGQTRTTDEANQIGSITGGWITPTYDAAGNMISGPKTGAETTRVHYVYDAWNRLAKVYNDDGDGVFEPSDDGGGDDLLFSGNEYDGLNRRVRKIDEATGWSDHYYYNTDWQIVEDGYVDTNGVARTIDQYIWNPGYVDSPMVCLHDGDYYNADGDVDDTYPQDWRRYYLTDANHNVTTTIRYGKFGGNYIADVGRDVYTPYGKVTQTGVGWTGTNDEAGFDGPLYCGYFHDTDTGLYQVRNRYYDTSLSAWLNRDPLKADINLYRYCGNGPTNATDPQGTVIVLIHGVNTDAAWFANAKSGLADYRKAVKSAFSEEVVEFHWGDSGAYGGMGTYQGGYPNYATDSVAGISSSGYVSKERQYMVDTVRRLKNVLDALNRIKEETGAKESISVIAHSQGTILTLAALQDGAKIDNFIMMGSPLDIWPYDKANNDLMKAKAAIRGNTFNYWSSEDEWAYQKGGIGAYGADLAKIKDLGWIQNRKFGPGTSNLTIHGYSPPSTGRFEEYDHPDYMANAEFFARIHGVDLGSPGDDKISTDSGIETIRNIAKNW